MGNMDKKEAPPTGHRLVPHTADRIIEAWGAERSSCIVEALMGLVESFARPKRGPRAERSLPLSAPPSRPEEMLVALVEQVIYALDVFGAVPIGFELEETEEGGVTGTMVVVPVASVDILGAPPKAVSYHQLSAGPTEKGWRCRMLVDV